MTVPMDLARAQDAFDRLLREVMERADLTTRHQAYTVAEAVLRAYRRRLSVTQVIAFAQRLPPLLRAVFIADWDPGDAPVPFGSRVDWTADAMALRPHHNLAGQNAVSAVAGALRTVLSKDALASLNAGMPDGSEEFWK